MEKPQDIVRARRIELVDDKSRPRIEMFLSETGRPAIVMKDSTGEPVLRLSPPSDDSSGIVLGLEGGPGITIAVANRTPIIAFHDSEDKVRLMLRVNQDDSSTSILMNNANEEPCLLIEADAEGNTQIRRPEDDPPEDEREFD